MVLSVLERQNNEQNVRYENVKIPIPRVVTTNYSNAPFKKLSGEYSKLFDELEQQSPGNPEGINYHDPTIELELFGRGEYKPSGSIKKPTNNQTLYSTAATDSSIEFRPEDYPAKNWGSDSNYIKYPQPVTTIESIISSTDTPGFTSQFKTNPEYLFEMERTSSLQPKLQNIAQSTLTIPDNNPYSPPPQGLFTKVFHSLANPFQPSIPQIQNAHAPPSQWLLQTSPQVATRTSSTVSQYPFANAYYHPSPAQWNVSKATPISYFNPNQSHQQPTFAQQNTIFQHSQQQAYVPSQTYGGGFHFLSRTPLTTNSIAPQYTSRIHTVPSYYTTTPFGSIIPQFNWSFNNPSR